MTTSTTRSDAPGWRTLDIVVAAVISVAFGVVFLAWNALYVAATPLFAPIPALQAIFYGVWLLPGVLVGLIVRRPGAAFFGNFVAAATSAFLGSTFGADTLLSGAIQGLGAELGFAIGLYRAWTLPIAMLAGALPGLGATIHDIPIYYPGVGPDYWVIYAVAAMASGALIGGGGAWLLTRALVGTGVLADFAAGRGQREV